MLATPGRAMPEGPGWVLEPKWDGWRALAHVTGEGARIFTAARARPSRPLPDRERGSLRVAGGNGAGRRARVPRAAAGRAGTVPVRSVERADGRAIAPACVGWVDGDVRGVRRPGGRRRGSAGSSVAGAAGGGGGAPPPRPGGGWGGGAA